MDYAKAVALANRLINKNGRSVDVQRLSATASDPARPWKGAGTPTVAQTVTAKAVFLPVSSLKELGMTAVDDELLKRTHQVALLAGNSVDLNAFNAFIDGVSRWRIEWVVTLKPAGIILLYAFGVSR